MRLETVLIDRDDVSAFCQFIQLSSFIESLRHAKLNGNGEKISSVSRLPEMQDAEAEM